MNSLDMAPDLLNEATGVDEDFLDTTSVQGLEHIVENRHVDQRQQTLEGERGK